jgi:hypothetical protein
MEVTRVSAGDASEELFARLGQPEGAAVMGIVPAVYDRVMRGVEEAGVRGAQHRHQAPPLQVSGQP